MSLRRALAGVTLTAGLVAGLLPASTLAGGGTIRMVDDDGHAAPGNCGAGATARKRIQAAVDASHPGDTVLVCPGTYAEQVEIVGTHDLTVRSTTKWGAVIEPDPTPLFPVMVAMAGLRNVTFEGFRLVVPTTGDCQTILAAILLVDTRETFVRGNHIRTSGPNTLGPCGYQVGIAVGEQLLAPTVADLSPAGDAGPRTDATVLFNTIQDFQFAGVAATGERTTATINRNSIRYFHAKRTMDDVCNDFVAGVTSAGSDIRAQLRRLGRLRTSAGVDIAGALPTACLAIGVLIAEDASTVVKDNRIHSGPDSVTVVGRVGDATTPILLAGVVDMFDEGLKPSRIADNRIYRTIAGVAILVAQNTKVLDNRLTSNGIGLYLDSVDQLLVQGNRLKDNGVGIGMMDLLLHFFDSYANRFLDNDARGNFSASCVDLTSDGSTPYAGDLGTDNRWRDNTAELDSSEPAGICGAMSPP